MHSGKRDQVIAETARVLKPGGELVFTDPMQSDDCPVGVLEPVLQRIHLETMGSPAFYIECAAQNGLQLIALEDLSHQLVHHYSSVLAQLEQRQAEITKQVSAEYVHNMQQGLRHWITAGQQNHLAWGIFHFRKT